MCNKAKAKNPEAFEGHAEFEAFSWIFASKLTFLKL